MKGGFGDSVRNVFTNGASRAFIVLIFMLLVWAKFQPNGLKVSQLDSYLTLALPLAAAAMGVTVVLISGEFDLSAAGVIALVNVLLATTFTATNPLVAAVAVIVIAALIGLVNGLFVVFGKLPAIAVTLATFIILGGLAQVLLPQPGGQVPQGIVDAVMTKMFIPRALLILIVLGIGWLWFKRTRLGIHMFGLGEDEAALHLSGVNVRRTRLWVFAIGGALYGLAGVFFSALTGSGDANSTKTYLLATFAAVAIGGVSFAGGSGSGLGSIFGALVLLAIPKVLFVLKVSDWMQMVVQGIVIIAAVLVGALAVRRAQNQAFLSLGREAEVDSVEIASEGKA